ncbi:MAG: hypothetical protein HC884_02065 [Chloroflexaceae bacterium]|nr:hypothetical protein [Chloroflexaceae bacterium]
MTMRNERERQGEALWERQPGEGKQAYEAARVYFELGPRRSLAEVARMLGKSRGTIKGYSSRYRWRERARAFDAQGVPPEEVGQLSATGATAVACSPAPGEGDRAHPHRQTREELEWEMSQALLARVREMLVVPLSELRWSPRDVAVYFDLAMDLMQRAAKTLEETEELEEMAESKVVTVRVTYVDEGGKEREYAA